MIIESGSEADKKHAAIIEPIRRNGNLLLCVLLVGNTMVNAALAIFMGKFTGGFSGWLISTCLILVFGEITPQAICSRHGLMIGATMAPLLKLIIGICYPIAKPISMALDVLLGQEVGISFSRGELVTLLKLHADIGDINDQEAEILHGVLHFSLLTVDNCMTALDKVYSVPISGALDEDTMDSIYKTGHSRIPVYEGSKSNIVGVIFVKDLVVLDPEDAVPVSVICSFYDHELPYVTTSDKMLDVLNLFTSGHAHMAMVAETPLDVAAAKIAAQADEAQAAKADVESGGGGPPMGDTGRRKSIFDRSVTSPKSSSNTLVGLVTIEDLLEQILRQDIVDEAERDIGTHKRDPKALAAYLIAGGHVDASGHTMQRLQHMATTSDADDVSPPPRARCPSLCPALSLADDLPPLSSRTTRSQVKNRAGELGLETSSVDAPLQTPGSPTSDNLGDMNMGGL